MNLIPIGRAAFRQALAAGALLGMAVVSPHAAADPVIFNTDPFTGSTALNTPGRQIFQGPGSQERTLPSFSTSTDTFTFNLSKFGMSGPLSFLNALSSAIPGAGANVIVLEDTDNDGNPATPFVAGTAANVIAGRVNTDGAGFFIYHNSVLDVNRLVFSTNLNDANADLSVLARIASPTGQDAINGLAQFSAGNFGETVPEPSSVALLAAGLFGMTVVRRRKG